MPPTALTNLYTSQDWVEALLSAEGVSLRLDDDASGAVSASELTRLTTQAINIATARVNSYLVGRYEPSVLVDSWETWDWATIIAARWLCSRRLNPVPESLQGLYEEVIEALKEVRAGVRQLATEAPRDEQWPAWSNVEVDHRYWLRKIRKQAPISESARAPRTARSRWSDQVYEW